MMDTTEEPVLSEHVCPFRKYHKRRSKVFLVFFLLYVVPGTYIGNASRVKYTGRKGDLNKMHWLATKI